MKYFLFLLSLFIVIPTALIFSQGKTNKAKVSFSPELKESRRTTLSGILGKTSDGIFALQTEVKLIGSSKFIIQKYSHDMKLKRSVEFDLKEGKKQKLYEGSFFIKGKLYIFSSFVNKGEKKNYFFRQTINLKTLKLNDDLEKIAEVSFKGFLKYNSGNFSIDNSRDSSKILVYYNRPYQKKEKEKYGYHVFDQEFQELYSKKITLPYSDQLYDLQNFAVDNDGNMHIVGKIFKDKRRDTRKGKPNYDYEITSYYDKGETKERYPIKVPGKYLNDMQVAIDDEGNIACGGFYASNASFNVDGTYWLKIDPKTQEIISQNFKEFDIDFITQNMKKRQEKKAKRKEAKGKEVGLFSYDLDEIIFDNSGGAVLIGEQYFITTSTSTDSNGRTRTTYRYHYNDIIVVKISSDGNIDWAEKIPKVQVSTNDGGFYSSYHLSIVKGNLYFVFNDNPKNLTNEGDGKLKNYVLNKESIVVLVTMNGKGEQVKEALFDTREAEVYIRPKVGRQTGFAETVLFGQKRKAQKLAKVSFK